MNKHLPQVPAFPDPLDALYLHVPFCFHKCHYCDFYSLVDKADPERRRHDEFTSALIAELQHQAERYVLRPRTIFVGGGTPTLLQPRVWDRLMAALRELGALDRVEEFTVECNPETLTAELAETLAAGGVNRMSMGAQTFQPHLLKALERWHDPASVGRAIGLARAAGIGNVNLDLIFAIPGQTLGEVDADLDAALALGPTHLSCYSLIFEPHTPLTQKMKLGQVEPVEEDLERAMYERVIDRLAAEGFEHYEVSNWARQRGGDESAQPPYRCLHNMIYWQNGNWIGAGPSAASHVAGRRWKNKGHLGQYLAEAPQPPVVDEEELPRERRVGEQIMLALRLREGARLDWLDDALRDDAARQATVEHLLTIRMLERTPSHLRLTREGLFVADAVIAQLL